MKMKDWNERRLSDFFRMNFEETGRISSKDKIEITYR